MAIESSLTKQVGKKGENKKSPLEWPSPESSSNNSSPIKGISQGDSDSESTSVTSSIHGSTSSATTPSFDQDSARGKKTLEKSKSKKLATFGSFMSFRRRAQSRHGQSTTKVSENELTNPQHSSPVDVSDESHDYSEVTSKRIQKFTRTGSLRSVRLSRNKNKFTLKSRKSSISKSSEISEDLPLERATFSSILKDSKFPKQLETRPKLLESEGAIPEGQFCPYQHCSLHGHHHHHNEPPPQRFTYLKRRTTNDQNALNPKSQTGEKQKVKVTKKVSNEVKGSDYKMDDGDFSMEFYSKTRSEPLIGSKHGHDDVDFADILFGVNSFDQNRAQNQVRNSQMEDQDNTLKQKPMSNEQSSSDFNDVNSNGNSNGFNGVLGKKSTLKKVNRISMWHTIHRHMVSGLTEEVDEQKRPASSPQIKDFDNGNMMDDATSQETEIRKMFAIKLVREAIEKILLPEVQDDQSTTSEVISEQDSSESSDPTAIDDSKQEPLQKQTPKRWSYLKKVILLTKFVKEVEKVKNFNPKNPRDLPFVQEREAETVSLRRQTMGDKKKNDEWMLDYALRQVVSELAPTQKRKVALLVKAFETVAPTHDDPQIRAVNRKVNDELKRVSCVTNDKSQGPGEVSFESKSKSNEQRERDFRDETAIGNDVEKEKHIKDLRVSAEFDKSQEPGELSFESKSKSNEQRERDFRDETAIGKDVEKEKHIKDLRVDAELQRVSSGNNDKSQQPGESSVGSKSNEQREHDFGDETNVGNDLEKEKHIKELWVNELQRASSETNDKTREPGESSVESKSNEQHEREFGDETATENDLEKENYMEELRVNAELQRVSFETNNKTQEPESKSKSNDLREYDSRAETAIGNDSEKEKHFKDLRVDAELQRVSSETNDKTQEPESKSKSKEEGEHGSRDETAIGNGLEKEKHIKMWHMIYQHVAIDIATKVGSDILLDGEESANDEHKNFQEVENHQERDYKLRFTKSDAVKLVRESVNEILVPEDDEIGRKKVKIENGFETQKSKNWGKIKKLILLKRSIKALESFGKLRQKAPNESVVTSDQETEIVDLKSQMTDERKKAEQWMLDYAVQHIVTKLTPARKKRVSMLVEAFEAVVPLPQI